MRQKGFTLVELLVAIGIIGILSSIAVVSVSNVRVKARDAKRLADVKQIQTALEAYLNDQSKYPSYQGNLGTAGASDKLCETDAGFQTAACNTTYINPVPANPKPNGQDYAYASKDNATPPVACVVGKTCVTYTITFKLESGSGTYTRGTYQANENGIVRTGDY